MNGSFGCTTARTADVVDDKKSSDKTKNLAKMQRKQVVLFIIDLMCDKRRPVLVNERKHPNGTVCAIRKESISRVRNEPISRFSWNFIFIFVLVSGGSLRNLFLFHCVNCMYCLQSIQYATFLFSQLVCSPRVPPVSAGLYNIATLDLSFNVFRRPIRMRIIRTSTLTLIAFNCPIKTNAYNSIQLCSTTNTQ